MLRPVLPALAALLLATPLAAAEPRPNVVIFLVDDLGFMDIGANNPATFYETPAIDTLARDGVRFTNGYAACPVCSPTRAALHTGKYPSRTGITDYIGADQPAKWPRPTKLLPASYVEQLALEETTLAEAFKAAGYATFFAGKWHLGSERFWPEHQGFDFNLGGWDRGGPYGGNKYFSPYGNPRLTDGPPGEHLPDRLATETARFIAAQRDRPFFAMFSFYSVHTPLMAREDLKKKYEAKAAARPVPEPKFGREGARPVRLVQDHAVYAGMVEAMDQAVGKVMQALRDAGVAGRTIVVFTSDNGGLSTAEGSPTSNAPWRAGKGWAYEGGVRVPFIVAGPGVARPGAVSDAVLTSPDLYPTLLELAGLPARPAQHVDGVSFAPALRGAAPARGPVYWHYPHYGNQGGAPYGAVRDGDWKLIEWYEDGALELFNLAADPSEQSNLAAAEPARAQALREKLGAWRVETGAKMPAPNPRFPPQSAAP
jgi:arylsulfatase A-like enzyme